jgi:hypothetical protein
MIGQREKCPLLVLSKDDPRSLTSGSMGTHARGFLTPFDHLVLGMLPVPKVFFFKKALPHIGNLSFDGGFPFRISG